MYVAGQALAGDGLHHAVVHGCLNLDQARRRFARLDAMTIGFASLQLLVVPVLAGHPILQAAVLGHVVAVALVAGVSILTLR